MIIAITERYERFENEKIWKENFYVNKYFKDIFEELNITLFPVASCTGIEKIVNICDGLLVSGSHIDINPKYYGEEALKETNLSEHYDKQEEVDFALIKAFHKQNKPILGICAGIQSINVCFGGSLYQDIPNHSIKGDVKFHKINLEKGSFLEKCYNKNHIEVNSFHHQAVKKPAENFRITATSEDGIIEAIEYKNILGVQWHPEQMNDIKFFKEYFKR